MTLRVAILEDDTVQLDRYEELIRSAADMCLLWTASTLADALNRFALPSAATDPLDIFLVDLGLPDGSGLTAIQCCRKRNPSCEVMVVTVFGDEQHVVAAIEAGASGYLLKDALADTFLGTIRELHAGGSPISPSIARILLRRSRTPEVAAPAAAVTPAVKLFDATLAERELEILTLVAKGFNFSEIGRLLDISTNTVKTHIYRIYRKLAVHSRSEAVFEAKKLGLLDF